MPFDAFSLKELKFLLGTVLGFQKNGFIYEALYIFSYYTPWLNVLVVVQNHSVKEVIEL